MLHQIGLRNVKTAVAVMLCVLISQALRLEYPFYAAIAAIISMESSMALSFRAGRNRMMGTLVGAGLGLLFAILQPDNALLCGVGMVLLIWICNRFEWNSSISIAGIVFLAIMVNMGGRNPLAYSLNRILDTTIGISVALLVNYLLFPRYHAGRVEKNQAQLVGLVREILARGVAGGQVVDLEPLNTLISEAEASLALHRADVRWSPRWVRQNHPAQDPDVGAGQSADLARYRILYQHLAVIPWEDAQRRLNAANAAALAQELHQPIPAPEAASPANEDEANLVYNYHIRQILQTWHGLAGSAAAV
jgi:uncharacterized membrane protein YccC